MDEIDRLKQEVREGRIGAEQLVELLVKLQKQLGEAQKQLGEARRQIEDLQ
jgi:hypothetical protein